MLNDRIALVEQEIQKLLKECSHLYHEIAIYGNGENLEVYNTRLDNLHQMIGERTQILNLMNGSHN